MPGAREARARKSNWRWVPPGEAVAVGGLTLPGGMLYVGAGQDSLRGYGGSEPALIDPSLSLGRTPDHVGQGLGYWPSYDRIPPNSRTAYLHWLAGGRQDPQACIGYVFLFLYGLERRVFVDAAKDPTAAAELPALRQEVKRLLSLYHHNGSFASYAGSFATALSLLGGGSPLRPVAIEAPAGGREGWLAELTARLRHGDDYGDETPFALRCLLAAAARDGAELPWQVAWVWGALQHGALTRTVANRCGPEYQALFRVRYRERFSGGAVLQPGKRALRFTYRPASASFAGEVKLDLGGLTEAKAGTVRRQLQELAADCEAELDAYSRYLGRNPDSRGTLEASALMPSELLQRYQAKAVAGFRDRLKQAVGGRGWVRIGGSDLIRWWPGAEGEKLTKRQHVQVAQLLAKLGFGLEPDPRFGGPVLAAADQGVVFTLPQDGGDTDTPEYRSATMLLRLFVAVAAADGVVDQTEQAQLVEHVQGDERLTTAERVRLMAHLRWLMKADLGLKGLSKSLAALPADQRMQLGEFMLATAAADGIISHDEVRTVEKIYKLLELDPGLVHSHLHQMAAGGEPAPLTAATPADASFQLDQSRVQAALQDAGRLSSLLGELFDDDEPLVEPAGQAAQVSIDDAATVDGLDVYHSTLVRRIAAADSWSREEFEALAAELGLLPDGALDRLNEATLDLCDELLLEGDDTLHLNREVMEELLA